MKNLKKIWQNKIFYIGIIIVLAFVSSVLGRSSETDLRSIVTAIGVDASSDFGVEISANILIPKGESNVIGNTQMVFANGQTVSTAISNLGVKLGKKLGLAHCEVVVFNVGLFEDDAIKYLDFFIRTNNLTTNAVFVVTRDKSRDVLKSMTDSSSPYNSSLRNNIEHNDDFLITAKMNVESFYKAYYNYESVAVLGVFDLRNPDDDSVADGPDSRVEGAGSASGDSNLSSPNTQGKNLADSIIVGEEGSSAGSSGQDTESEESGGGEDGPGGDSGGSTEGGGDSSEKDTKVLDYKANMIIVKRGKKVRELNKDEILFVKLLHPYIRTMYIQIDNVDTASFKNGTLVFEIFDKTIKTKTYFMGETPVVKILMDLDIKFAEVMADEYTQDSLNEVYDILVPNVYQKVEEKIERQFAELIKNSKETKSDILAVFSRFYKFDTKKWNNYLQNLEEQERYLDGVLFEVEIKASTKI